MKFAFAISCATFATAAIVDRDVTLKARQGGADLQQLVQLASLAGIPLPTNDPALLLSLGPLASRLAAALPTSSVLNVLITAAPSGFVSSIVHDPAYAASFESDFAAGNSPSWFRALPTDVKSYLHTYGGGGGISALGGVGGVIAGVGGEMTTQINSAATETGTASLTASMTGSGLATATSTSFSTTGGDAISPTAITTTKSTSETAIATGSGSTTRDSTTSTTTSTAASATPTGQGNAAASTDKYMRDVIALGLASLVVLSVHFI